MSREEFLTVFLALLNKDIPKPITTNTYRTMMDTEADRFAQHCYDWFCDEARRVLVSSDLVTALLKTKRLASEQDRAEAILRLL